MDEHALEAEFGTYGHENIKVIYPWANIRIGKFCSISEDIVFLPGGEHMIDNVSTYGFYQFEDTWGKDLPVVYFTNGDIVIGNDVWIGYGVTILSGVEIGDGAVIGARAVITKNIPPYAVVVGNNFIVRFRFTKRQIESLLQIKWWEWEPETIKKFIPLLNSSKIEEFLKSASRVNSSTSSEQYG